MNKCTLTGRLTKDPALYRTENSIMARYTLAVDALKRDGETRTNFISCVTFNKSAEFAEKYLHKGMKIGVVGHIQTGSYKNKEGVTIYTTDVVVEEHEFLESKSGSQTQASASTATQSSNTTASKDDSPFANVAEDNPFGMGSDNPFAAADVDSPFD